MTRTLITGPAESITLSQAKLHLRVDHADDDTLISGLITAVREAAEHVMGRLLGAQTWQVTLDAFPAAELELGPDVSSIVSIQYLDAAGAAQTMPGTDYVLDSVDVTECWVLPVAGMSWPSTADTGNAVRVRITAGMATVPESVRAWMLLRLGTLYANRASVVAGVSLAELPGGFSDRLLDRYRNWSA